MKEALEKDIISEKTGNDILSKMLAKRRRLGAETFTDYLKLRENIK